MSLLQYFKSKDGLPDPRGELSSSVTSRAISRAIEVQAELEKEKKRGPYRRYTYCSSLPFQFPLICLPFERTVDSPKTIPHLLEKYLAAAATPFLRA